MLLLSTTNRQTAKNFYCYLIGCSQWQHLFRVPFATLWTSLCSSMMHILRLSLISIPAGPLQSMSRRRRRWGALTWAGPVPSKLSICFTPWWHLYYPPWRRETRKAARTGASTRSSRAVWRTSASWCYVLIMSNDTLSDSALDIFPCLCDLSYRKHVKK